MLLETRKTNIRPVIAFQFAGQGSAYLQELRNLYEYESPALRDFFQVLLHTLEEEYTAADVREASWTPDSFRLADWLNGESEPVNPHDVMISAPLIMAAQVGNYLRFLSAHPNPEELHASVVMGHSQGVTTALLIAGGKSGSEFLKDFSLYLRAVFRQAFRCRQAYPTTRIPEYLAQEELQAGLHPAPMASVQGATQVELQELLNKFQGENPNLSRACIGLWNAERSGVISGPEETLAHFRRFLGKQGGRKLAFHYLAVNIPFHSPYLSGAPELLREDFRRMGLDVRGEDLKARVPATEDGGDLRTWASVAEYLSRSSIVNSLNWQAVVESALGNSEVTHVLGFGPGKGLERMTSSYTRGRGIAVQALNTREAARIFATTIEYEKPWSAFAPRAVRLPDGRPFILNEYSRFTGRSPIFGGGMTPTTTEIDLVLAAGNAGRVVEWAGGGQVTEALMRKRMDALREGLEPGQGIIINLLYLDAYLWNLHYPLVRRLKKEGYPIDGVTISAGIPDKDEALVILDALDHAGIHLNSFKPGTTEQIRAVLDIARARPERKLIMQVEGGAAGGHHSWENLQELIRENYADIRETENIILAVGGGILDEEQAAAWLLGTWNATALMPVDAVFLGTRLMAAQEARTADTVKNALTKIQGDADWTKGQNGESLGGIVSGRSGLNADIYYAQNHWSRTSNRLEKLVRNKSSEEITRSVAAERHSIIRALNKTAKPYFGEIRAMTYARVLRRFVELTAPGTKLNPPEGIWPDAPFIDDDYRKRLVALIRRFENRFASTRGDSLLSNEAELDEPAAFLQRLFVTYPDMRRRRLLPEDENFFFEVIARPGKPVNFIPILDENILKWYRSDSLWYSHCPGIDPESCAWIPGPAAVAGIKEVNEPVNEILAAFEERVLKYTSPVDDEFNLAGPVDIQDPWIRSIKRIGGGFLAVVLSSPRIIRGKEAVPTDLRELFAPRPGRRFAWERDDAGRIRSIRIHGKNRKMPEIELSEKDGCAELKTHFHGPRGKQAVYTRRFYPGPGPHAPVLESLEERETVSAAFYDSIWDMVERPAQGDVVSRYIVKESDVERFRAACGDPRFAGMRLVPPGMAIVFIWQSLVGALPAGGDLFRLLHRSHSFEFKPAFARLAAGDELEISARCAGHTFEKNGKLVRITGEISVRGDVTASFAGEFFIRGDFRAQNGRSIRKDFPPISFRVQDGARAELLMESPFLHFRESVHAEDELRLEFSQALEAEQADGTMRLSFLGKLLRGDREIAQLALERDNARVNPVFALLDLFENTEEAIPLDRPYRMFAARIHAPRNPEVYAAASGDWNPIHLNRDFAVQAGLSEPITHGMWTASQAMRLLVDGVLRGNGALVEKLESRFEAPVLPGQEVFVEFKHFANRRGRRLITIIMENQTGELVYSGTAVVLPASTAYVFTGQGSQTQGMGMDFYDRFAAAREVWERVEKVTRNELGFSLLEIVRDNPTELRVDGEVKRHPQGVLNLTEFTQPALVVKAVADHRVLAAAGLLADSAFFAGHSLGEYAALACRSILDLEAVVRIVHHRGLTMQRLVERDDQGRSPFGMSVILANRALGLVENDIVHMVRAVAAETGLAVEVVNFNIRDKQYSVTGHLQALDELEKRLRAKAKGHRVFKRLSGIDVPFHSSLLSDGVDDFRAVLQRDLSMDVDYSVLDGRYIPNLTAEPFQPTLEYLDLTLGKSGSPVLAALREGDVPSAPELRRTLLIELLAYQFARPVLWIGTQEHLFLKENIGELLDIGPRGDLAGMARQTLKDLHPPVMPRILHIEENRAAVFYELEDVESPHPVEKADEQPEDSREENPSPAPPAPLPHGKTSVNEPLSDEPFRVMQGLKTVLAVKAGLRLDEIKDTATIEDIFQGNSSKRNQALADLGAEFNTTALEGAHEKSLSDTSVLIAENTRYEKPGPFLRSVFDELVKNRMPGDFGRSQIFSHMTEERCMPAGRVFAASAGLTLLARDGESAGEGPLSSVGLPGRLKSKSEAIAWLDQALDLYGTQEGIRIPRRATADAGTGLAVDAQAMEELEDKYFGIHGVFDRMWRFGREAMQGDPFAPFIEADRERVRAQEARSEDPAGGRSAEGGEGYDRSLASRFSREKIVEFSSSIQWAKRNLLKLFWDHTNASASENPNIARQIGGHAAGIEPMRKFLENKARAMGRTDTAELLRSLGSGDDSQGRFRPVTGPFRPRLDLTPEGIPEFHEVPTGDYAEWIEQALGEASNAPAAEITVTEDSGNSFQPDARQQEKFRRSLAALTKEGACFRGRTALVTGAGKNSIALELVKNLLAGGMTVIVTTSSYSDEKTRLYKQVYQQYGVQDSRLLLIPFSQGSLRDIQGLMDYIKERNLQPDYLIPFGALGEENSLTDIDGDSLAGMRVMLLGVHGLIGGLAKLYSDNHARNKKFDVLLPLSPNHGNFGRDGLYAETKLALEALFRKWFSEHEDWGRFTRIRGCRIGWVRGTGLMELNDSVAPELEARANVRTFHRTEMAFLLTGLLTAEGLNDVVLADLDGGLGRTADLRTILNDIRTGLGDKARLLRELNTHRKALNSEQPPGAAPLTPLGGVPSPFPAGEGARQTRRQTDSPEVDLTRMICVVGYGEVGPGGSARTRWELEKDGEFSIEGAVELAWTMGLVKYEKGPGGYAWTDTSSGETLREDEIHARYEKTIREGTGIRLVNAELQKFDPLNASVYADVVLQEDYHIPAGDEAEARAFHKALPDESDVYFDSTREQWFVRRRKGGTIKVLKSASLSRYAAGQIPDGWDAERYGIPRDLVRQVDRVTLFNLVATAEAFVAAGMEPFELYRYLHPADVGNTSGSGMGGMWKLKRMYLDYPLDEKRQHDTLQEALINVTSAWAITSFVGGTGPVQTPVAACATAGVSVDLAVSMIREGRASFVAAGAFDDLSESGMLGFGDMNATAHTDEMLAQGIGPERMCRPNDARRGGFLESQGGGTILLARGDLALRLGLPVYGVIAHTAVHTDGIQASIPAPGMGLLSVARTGRSSKPVDTKLEIALREKLGKQADEIAALIREHLDEPREDLSPLGHALARYGLTADDIAVVYKHDTSTRANDPNENRLHHEIQKALGRTPGNPLFVVSQKSVTGHTKGGAAAMQLIGLLQCMNQGILPPNRNLDEVDPAMEEFSDLVFSDCAIQTGAGHIRAGLVTTLGFGHIGALILCLHGSFFTSMLDEQSRRSYLRRAAKRESKAVRRERGSRLASHAPLYERRMKNPYGDDKQELRVLLDANARMQPHAEAYDV